MDTDPDAHTAVFHRLSRLSFRYPHLLPPEVTQGWGSRLPIDTRTIIPEVFTKAIPKGVYVILVSTPIREQHLLKAHKGNTRPSKSAPLRLARLIQ